MFRSFIYLDTEKLYSYKSTLDGKMPSGARSISKTTKKQIGISASGAGAGLSSENTTSETIKPNSYYDYSEFEKNLAQVEGESYFDFVQNSEKYALENVLQMSLVLICGKLNIPEAFDLTDILNKFKSSFSQDLTSIEAFISKDIPIIIDSDDTKLSLTGKLNPQFLIASYDALEEYIEQDAYFLCKMERIERKDTVKIFDPLKDFLKIPRSMRRQANFDIDGFREIGVDDISINGPVARVEVIAIYK